MTQFIYRRNLRRSQGGQSVSRPEVLPGQPLQAIMNSANMQGGDIIELGPYVYVIPNGITVPAYVTLKGVPNQTRIVLLFNDDSPVYGPVVTVEGNGRIQDCSIDFDLTKNGALSGYTFAKDGLAFTTPSGTSNVASTYNNSVVKLNGARARIQDCHIPAGVRRGIVVAADQGIIIGNEIEYDETNNNAAVYLEDTIKHCVVSSNIVLPYDSTESEVSVKTGLDNVVIGNLATLVERA